MNTNGNAGGARSEETLQAMGVDRASLERTRDGFETAAARAGLVAEALAALNQMSAAINTWLPHDGSDKDAELHQAMKAANRVRPRLAAATTPGAVGSQSEATMAASLRDAAAEGMIQLGLDPEVVKAGFAAAAAMESELVELLDDVAGYIVARISPDHGVDKGWGLLARLAKVRTVVTDPEGPVLERPHIGALGSVCSFDVTLRVDTKKLALVVDEDAHDVVGLLSSAHSVEHAMAAAYLNRALEGDVVVLEAKPQSTINQGNAGFHLLTITCDGYGDLVAEAEDGTELGRETAEETEPENWNLRAAALGLVGKVLEMTPEGEESPETEAAVKKVLEGELPQD